MRSLLTGCVVDQFVKMLADIVVNGGSVFHGKLSFLFRRSGMIDKTGCKIAEYAGDDNHT